MNNLFFVLISNTDNGISLYYTQYLYKVWNEIPLKICIKIQVQMMNSVFHEFEFTCTLSVQIIRHHLNCVCQMYHTCSEFNTNSIQYQVMFVSQVIFNYTTNMKDQVLQTDILFLHTKLGYGGFNPLKMSLNVLADLDSTTNSWV